MKDKLKRLYCVYQLDWMISHGYSLYDLLKHLDKYGKGNVKTLFSDWEICQGFNNEIWASYCDFQENEFLDEEYMGFLISLLPLNVQNEYIDWYKEVMRGV
jgi:hypothetical protein